jgi:hypothetical protein
MALAFGLNLLEQLGLGFLIRSADRLISSMFGDED